MTDASYEEETDFLRVHPEECTIYNIFFQTWIFIPYLLYNLPLWHLMLLGLGKCHFYHLNFTLLLGNKIVSANQMSNNSGMINKIQPISMLY